MDLPIIGISAGDPSGIGPEITAKALANKDLYDLCKPLVICDPWIIQEIVAICNLGLAINIVDDPNSGKYIYGTIDVININFVDQVNFEFNKVSSRYGKASFKYVEKVIELALQGSIDATVTGPISKESIQLAGFKYAGHTEIFAEYTHTKNYSMLLADGDFRVAHVSTHVSLRQAIEKVRKQRVYDVICLCDMALKRIGVSKPRIAVAGLNPHAGENGLFGNEDFDEILPAVELAQSEGVDVDGPHPADTIFPKMKGGQYDVVVCMYHDQGHIPTKLLAFDYDHNIGRWKGLSGVNITLGLPIIRVSVDHGVAFDKGGKNEANEESMVNAIKYAISFSK